MGISQKWIIVLTVVFIALISISAAIYFKSKTSSSNSVIVTTPPDNVFSRNTPTTTPTKKPVSATTPTPYIISKDLPPLYPGVEWNLPEQKNKIAFRNLSGNQITMSGIYLDSKYTSTYKESFFEYYITNLENLNWTEVDSAGGPDGELYHFQKNDLYLTLGYKVTKDKSGVGEKLIKYQYYIITNIQ